MCVLCSKRNFFSKKYNNDWLNLEYFYCGALERIVTETPSFHDVMSVYGFHYVESNRYFKRFYGFGSNYSESRLELKSRLEGIAEYIVNRTKCSLPLHVPHKDFILMENNFCINAVSKIGLGRFPFFIKDKKGILNNIYVLFDMEFDGLDKEVHFIWANYCLNEAGGLFSCPFILMGRKGTEIINIRLDKNYLYKYRERKGHIKKIFEEIYTV